MCHLNCVDTTKGFFLNTKAGSQEWLYLTVVLLISLMQAYTDE